MTKDELFKNLYENGKNLGNINQETESDINNLLNVINNQAGQAMEHLEMAKSKEAERRVLPFLFQIQTLVSVIHERIEPDSFIAAENIAFYISEYEKAQV